MCHHNSAKGAQQRWKFCSCTTHDYISSLVSQNKNLMLQNTGGTVPTVKVNWWTVSHSYLQNTKSEHLMDTQDIPVTQGNPCMLKYNFQQRC